MATATASKPKTAKATAKANVAAQVAATLTAPPQTTIKIGPTIDKMFELREKKRELMAEVEKIEADSAVLEEKLMERLDAEGTTKGDGTKAAVSISSSVVGNVTDREAFNAWVIKKKYLHLYQQRLSDPAVRELFEKGVTIPGCVPFTKRRLNLRVKV